VYSKEEPIKPKYEDIEIGNDNKRTVPASISFVPSVAGMIIASEVIKDLINIEGVKK
jgi:tRNA A37 threonylcarbamoyladenosine dehydratase